MAGLTPSMRLKVKADTFYLPDNNGVVYFHNNEGSFEMQGTSIDQWIEKLLPVFNGVHTLADLTDGLPAAYRERIYEIAEVLHRNGFVQDVSQDRPHQLSDVVSKRYACNIEFLSHFADSGAYRFQLYRQSQVLAVGCGPLLQSLVTALLETGLQNLHLCITDAVPTNRARLAELVAHAKQTDAQVFMDEETWSADDPNRWQTAVDPFEYILYVGEADDDLEELHVLHAVCREKGKVLIPALFVQQVGLVGPLVRPDSDACLESAWRRIHQSALCKDPELHAYSATAGAVLTNLAAFELFKAVTGVTESELHSQFYLINLETLEGGWHTFLPHPAVSGLATPAWVVERQLYADNTSDSACDTCSNTLFPYFSQLTSPISGIFHTWGEGDLQQLPLAQCYVQVVDVSANGPPGLLPGFVCSGLTHEEARREAGLSGIEAYVSPMASQLIDALPGHPEIAGASVAPQEFVGIGAGETVAEGVCRALQKCLAQAFAKRQLNSPQSVSPLEVSDVSDEACRFYFQALTTLAGVPVIGAGEDVFGFPVVWVGTRVGWYGRVGFNLTLALRQALQRALMAASEESAPGETQPSQAVAVTVADQRPQSVVVPVCEPCPQQLQSALQVLKQNGKRLLVFNLAVEPFLQEHLAGVFGAVLQEEGPA